MKNSWLGIMAIVVLLIIQAYCDLALPTYTSDLLNVGLQQSGIENAVPDTLREESMKKILLFVSDENAEFVSSAYGHPDSGGIMTLSEDTDRDRLNDILLVPESIVLQMDSTPEGAEGLSQMLAAVDAGMMTKSDIQAQMANGMSALEELTDTYLSQIAVRYVSAEYEAQGLDLDEIRNDYLLKVGGKMLLMALGMAIVAIITGYIASVISAGIGRDLREQLFEKVLIFLFVCFIFAGIEYGLSVLSGGQNMIWHNSVLYVNISLLTLIISTIISYAAVSFFRYYLDGRNSMDEKYVITITRDGKTASFTAVGDTCNNLTDIFTGKPVIVCGRNNLSELFERRELDEALSSENSVKHINGWRLIPFSTIASGGMLPVFQPAAVIIKNSESSVRKSADVYIGVVNRDMEYAVFNPKIL